MTKRFYTFQGDGEPSWAIEDWLCDNVESQMPEVLAHFSGGHQPRPGEIVPLISAAEQQLAASDAMSQGLASNDLLSGLPWGHR